MSKAQEGMTLAQLLAKQGHDPSYQAMRREKDRALAVIAEQRRHEQSALLNDLASIGVDVDWVGRLLEIPTPDQRVYRVLL